MTTSPAQISLGLALALLSFVRPPKRRGVMQLRRMAIARGIKSVTRDGTAVPIRRARRSELLAALNGAEQ